MNPIRVASGRGLFSRRLRPLALLKQARLSAKRELYLGYTVPHFFRNAVNTAQLFGVAWPLLSHADAVFMAICPHGIILPKAFIVFANAVVMQGIQNTAFIML